MDKKIKSKEDALFFFKKNNKFYGTLEELNELLSESLIERLININYIKISSSTLIGNRWEISEYCKNKVLPKYTKKTSFLSKLFG